MLHYFKKFLLLFVCFSALVSLQAQKQSDPIPAIPPVELSITNSETSVLIFPHPIKSVDRGSRDILTKTVRDVSNVLKLKAATENFQSTNLHVFTADGKVYAFALKYNPTPSNLTLDLSKSQTYQANMAPAQFTADRSNDAVIDQSLETIAGLKPLRSSPRSAKKGNAQLTMNGAYLREGVLFFQFTLTNKAGIPYHIDFIRAYIRDKKKTRRASVTEQEVHPLFTKITNDAIAVPGQPVTIVLAFDQFTIADGKYLAIEAFEKNGDRVLSCKLKGTHLLKVKNLEQ